METTMERPSMNPLKMGAEFKTFSVSGKKGMEMPEHISTKEAVVMIKKGKALLKIDGEEQELHENELHIIPAGKPHSLLLLEDFEAFALMQKSSEIEFL
ncbi:MAG TPA: cupin domain-containing protein [Flavobacteriaceae bacterium]|nr:cupin domain-containing protein [Flavobacteriaceae bacterium]